MLHLQTGDTTQPFIILTDISNDFELTDNQEDERQAYDTYFGILKRLIREGLQHPDSTAIADLEDLEQNKHGKPAIFARNMLITIKEMTYSEPILLPDTSLKISKVVDPSLIKIEQNEDQSFLVVKPNPANDYVIVGWKIPETDEKVWLYVNDIKGYFLRKVSLKGYLNEMVLSTANWKPGTYIVNLVSDGTKYDSKKITIVK